MKNWNEASLDKLRERGLRIIDTHVSDLNDFRVKPKTKYYNKKCIVNGIEFDSTKEANRYKTLLLLLKAGVIGFLELQVPYELNTGGTHSLKYILDFRYMISKTGEMIHEDCKGMRTSTYIKKRRLMKKLFGITILET